MCVCMCVFAIEGGRCVLELMVLLVSERQRVVRACDNDEQFHIIYHSPEQHDRLRLEHVSNVNFQGLSHNNISHTIMYCSTQAKKEQ